MLNKCLLFAFVLLLVLYLYNLCLDIKLIKSNYYEKRCNSWVKPIRFKILLISKYKSVLYRLFLLTGGYLSHSSAQKSLLVHVFLASIFCLLHFVNM
jgi:hypothetical protein